MKTKLKQCPFCEEDDFDLPGLANHLNGGCDKYYEALENYNKEMTERYARNRRTP